MIKKFVLWAGVSLLVLVVLLAAVIVVNLAPDLPAAEVDQRYMSGASQFVVLDTNARIHFRDEGDPDGPALVLVHGYSDSLHTWEEWVRILSDEFRIVSIDMPAHGLTGRVPDDDYSPEAMVAAIHGVVTALRMECFSIAGNSMGGQISWLYTAAYPDRVEKLVLLDASGYPDHRPPPRWMQVLGFPGLAQVFRHISPRPLLESGWKAAFADQSRATPELFQRLEDMIRREGTRDALRIRRESWPSRIPVERLATIQQPTLILWGEKDVLVPPEHAELFNRDIANSRVIMYENVGHLPMQEIPERSAEDVRDFLLEAKDPSLSNEG